MTTTGVRLNGPASALGIIGALLLLLQCLTELKRCSNRLEQQEKMRRYYDKKTGGDRVRPAVQPPRAAPSVPYVLCWLWRAPNLIFCTRIVNEAVIRRHIRRIRVQDGFMTATVGPSLTKYAKTLLDEYKSLGQEDGRILFIDFIDEYNGLLTAIEVDLECIKEEGGILHSAWKEGSATRDKFARMLEYVEDMLGWAEKHKLRNAARGKALVFQQRT